MEFLTVTTIFWAVVLIAKQLGVGLDSATVKTGEDDTLILVHVLFRHGNRTANGPEEVYPKDPYVNETYFPVGLGQLTNAGKIKEFALGKALRRRYNNFLGPYYYPQIVEALSTDYNRTKASLVLVLAGLFPPNGDEVWNHELPWQPIPYNYEPSDRDKILLGVNCPNFIKLSDEFVHSTKHQTELNDYRNIFNYISNNTGLNVTTFLDVYNLYFGLATEEEWGFELPNWTKEIWPQIITDLAIKHYFVETGTTQLSQISAGYFLEKVIQETNAKISSTSNDRARKIHLYSAHENNIADALIVLGIFDPRHVPNYGSYLTFEVHNINGTYGIKIFYENYIEEEPRLMKLPACETFCEINKFISLMEEYIPSNDLCGIDNKCL